MRILVVGALSWNPERILSLVERGHELCGLWSRSMAWDQGPYRALEHAVRPVALEDAASIIRERRIDCVYSLFQVYRPRLWGPANAGVEHDVWTLLRRLLAARERGAFDAPIVRHWGFDVHELDLDVAQALDGHIFCNREKLGYWSTPARDGGCGLDVLGRHAVVEFLDGDRPKLEFMNDRFSERLSEGSGEIHTVCVGRPFNIDFAAAAAHGIHVHVYGNGFDEVLGTIAGELSVRDAWRSDVGRYLHVHDSLQVRGDTWEDVRRTKSRWVEEFSRYDAGWSYIGNPLAWPPLDDRAAIPNRLSTYLLAGVPVITDRRPGCYRYDELERLGVDIEVGEPGYGRLRERLEAEVGTRERQARALDVREGYSFDATIDRLLGVLERTVNRYFGRPSAERTRFRGGPEPVRARVAPGPRPRAVSGVRRAWLARRRALSPLGARGLARALGDEDSG
jgi:hypothetical protein